MVASSANTTREASTVKSLAVILLICLGTIPLADAMKRSVDHPAHQGEHGPLPLATIGRTGTLQLASTGPLAAGQRDGTLLWTRQLADAIYTSTGISGASGDVVAGTYLNPPKHTESSPILGGGIADWTFGGNEFFVDASQESGVIASVDFGAGDSTATVRCWQAGSGTPLWSYVISPCRTLVYQGWASRKPIQVSDDGSVIAVATVMLAGGGAEIGRLTAFSPSSGTPIVEWDFPTGNVVATDISADGNFVVMTGWPNIYVYDVANDTLRWSAPAGAGNDALAISGDGSYIAWGWSTFQLRQWNGSSYGSVWTHTPGGGLYVGQCALSNDSATLAVTWDNGNVTVNQVAVELYELPGVTQLWHHDYAGTPPSTHVDVPSCIAFSPDGQRLAVGSWGGSFPEIHVFERSGPSPLYTLDTDGSIFDIDITTAPGGASYVTACGKAVHAGTSGKGGDLYAIEIPAGTCQTDLGFGGPGSISLAICGDDLTLPGSTATLSIEGATPLSTVALPVGVANNPTPFKGGTLVPFPWLVLVPLATDASGNVTAPVVGSGNPPVTITMQAVDPIPGAFEFSNALEVTIGT
jgi:WD40 repeat protein